MKIQRTASLHEKAVQKVAAGEFEPIRASRQGARRDEPLIELTSLHPAMLKEARRACGGDWTRVRVVSPTEVIITNKTRRRV